MASSTIKDHNYTIETTTIDNQECEAGGGHFYTANITKTGKIPLAICGINIDNATVNGGRANWCAIWNLYIAGGTTASVGLHNYATGLARFKITFYVLYQSA